jgi:glycosyltransferase involved in cell wall biosynthesis
MENLKISIIMPSFNQVDYIEEAIVSILSQNYHNKELIIIDGGSTDGSIEIIQKYSHQLTYWVSESDSGQSNAINKGFAKATGDLLTWSNSDDILLPGAIQSVARIASSIPNPLERWITGGCYWLNADGTLIKFTHARSWSNLLTKYGLISIYAPSSFFSREIIDKVGYLDESFHYCMDTDLWQRFASSEISYTASRAYFWGLRLHANAKVSGRVFNQQPGIEPNPGMEKYKTELERIQGKYDISIADINHAAKLHRLSSIFLPNFWVDKFRTLRYRNKTWAECISKIS